MNTWATLMALTCDDGLCGLFEKIKSRGEILRFAGARSEWYIWGCCFSANDSAQLSIDENFSSKMPPLRKNGPSVRSSAEKPGDETVREKNLAVRKHFRRCAGC